MQDKAKKGGGCAAVEGRAALKRARLGDVRRLEKLRRKKRFNPTFHVYHNFRLKNFYILEKQPIIVEFLADFVSRGSVVKTEQKPTVGRSFDNNSRERGKSG